VGHQEPIAVAEPRTETNNCIYTTIEGLTSKIC